MSDNLLISSIHNSTLSPEQKSPSFYQSNTVSTTDKVDNESSESSPSKNTKGSFTGRQLSNQLRRLIRSSRKSSRDPKTIADKGEDPAVQQDDSPNNISFRDDLTGNPFTTQQIQTANENYDTLPPLPISSEPITESLIAQAEMRYGGPCGHNKAAPRTFHNTVSHLRNPRHASARATELEPHSSPYYPHQHLTLVERYALRGLKHGELRRRLEKTEETAEEGIKTHSSRYQSKSTPTGVEELQIQLMDVSVTGPSSLVESIASSTEHIQRTKSPATGCSPSPTELPMWSSRNVPSQTYSDSRDEEGMKELNGPSGLGVGKTTSTGSSTLPRNVPPYPNVPRGSTDKSRDTLDSNVHNSEPRNSVTVHSRFKQFWVESFVSGRCRTKSENQSGIAPHLQGDSSRVRSPVTELESSSISRKDVLPPHAHTITGGSSQATSLLRRLAQYTNMSTPPSDQMSIKSGTDSLKRTTHGRRGLLGHTSGVSSAGGRSGSVPIPPAHSLFVQGQHRRQKSPRAVIGRLVSGSGVYGKSTEDVLLSLDLPDPSKLPREEPCSSLEFTQARLKNPKKIPQKLKVRSGFDVHRRKRAGSLSGGDRHSLTGTVSPQARPFLLEHLSKSEETLISGNQAAAILFPNNAVSTRQSGLQGPDAIGTTVKPPAKQIPNHPQRQHQQQQQQQQHHHHHHHHHRHGNHYHHRSRGHLNHHDHHGIRATHTMTRVTESRRYLMFTRSLPFWSAKHYLETHGTGMGDSETYSVLFRHTECYELMPESAKLIILDSQLTISKAFRALIYNGIRAAPVWNSDTQTISTMLTVTDFVQMLNLCWYGTDGDRLGQKPILQMSDFDRITIQKWKELIKIDPLVRSKSSSFAPVVINKREGGSSCANDDPKISGTKLQPLSTSSSHAFSHDPCITISCPTSNVSSPSRSRSSSSGSRSSASSLPPDLLTAQKLCRHSSVDQPSVLERSSTVTTQSQLNSDTGTVTTPIRRASLGAPVQHSTSSGLPSRTSRLFFVHPEDSLLKALRLLSRFRLHHLPVIDPPRERSGNVLFVLTKRRLLSYLFSKMSLVPQPRFMQSSLADLNVGTFQCVSMITLSTKLSETLLLFRNGRISALPVVDSLEKRRLINLFSKYDVITLVVSGAYNNPDLTVREWLEEYKGKTSLNEDQRTPPPVETCLASNSLLYVAEKLEKTGFRRLVIVNNTTEYRVEGIISLSDVLRFIVIQQARSGTNIHGPPPPPSVAEEPDEATDEALKPPKPRQRTIKFELSPAHESDNEEKTLYTVRREDNVAMGTR